MEKSKNSVVNFIQNNSIKETSFNKFIIGKHLNLDEIVKYKKPVE